MTHTHGAPVPFYKRLYEERFIALLALLISVFSIAWTTLMYFREEEDERVERSIREVDRIYDPAFASSLSKILDHAYGFLGTKETNSLSGRARFETYWQTISADPDMLVIVTRLSSVEDCVARGDCLRKEVYSRFPDSVYQALYFLREFIFLPPSWGDPQPVHETTGWWIGTDIYDFLADYCRWATMRYGGMALWSVRHERLRLPPGYRLPPPCLPPRR